MILGISLLVCFDTQPLSPYDDGRLAFFVLLPDLYPDSPELGKWLSTLDGSGLTQLINNREVLPPAVGAALMVKIHLAGGQGVELAEPLVFQIEGVDQQDGGILLKGLLDDFRDQLIGLFRHPAVERPHDGRTGQRALLGGEAALEELNAACAGFLYGLKTAHALLCDAPRPCALVVGAEVISRVMSIFL